MERVSLLIIFSFLIISKAFAIDIDIKYVRGTAFKIDDPEYYNKFYYLFDRFVENINDKDFKKLYDEKPLSWKTSNFMGLEFLERLEDNPEQADEILNDVMRYASSSTKISSQFIKIS